MTQSAADGGLPTAVTGVAGRRRIVVNANQCFTLLRFRGDLLRSLVEAGHSVLVTLPEVSTEQSEALAALGVEHALVPMQRSGVNPFRDLAYEAALRRLYQRTRPDIVFSIMVKPAIYGSMAARRSGVPRSVAMFTGLGYAFDEPRSLKQRIASISARALCRYALRETDVVIFHNPDDMRLFVDSSLVRADQCRVVDGSGVDLSHFHPVPLPDRPSFLLVAKTPPGQGHPGVHRRCSPGESRLSGRAVHTRRTK